MKQPPSDFSNPDGVNAEQVSVYLDHILNSERFQKAPSLRQLLQYLVKETLEGRSSHIKEAVIGLDALGRREDFDCRTDNIVRVQAHRLRKLLEVYYAEEGQSDRFRILIPKGSYIPHVEPFDLVSTCVDSGADTAAQAIEETLEPADRTSIPMLLPPLPRSMDPAFRSGLRLAAAFLFGAVAVWLCLPFLGRSGIRANANPAGSKDMQLAPLWKGFEQPGVKTIVGFSSPVFLRMERSGSKMYVVYRGPQRAPVGAQMFVPNKDLGLDPPFSANPGPLFFSNSWTGTGELLAVHRLTAFFAQQGKTIEVKPSRALTFEDIKDANAIFVGYSADNEIPEKLDFGAAPFTCCEGTRIRVTDPKVQEPASYGLSSDQETKELSATYALVSIYPGISKGRKFAIVAGLSTHGTWGAIDYLTSAAGAKELARSLEKDRGPSAGYFQAVVRTEIIRGEVAHSSLVTARTVQPIGDVVMRPVASVALMRP